MSNNDIRTGNITAGAVLLVNGSRLDRITRDQSGQAIFHFSGNSTNETLTQYHAGTLVGNLSEFVSCLNLLRDYAHGKRELPAGKRGRS